MRGGCRRLAVAGGPPGWASVGAGGSGWLPWAGGCWRCLLLELWLSPVGAVDAGAWSGGGARAGSGGGWGRVCAAGWALGAARLGCVAEVQGCRGLVGPLLCGLGWLAAGLVGRDPVPGFGCWAGSLRPAVAGAGERCCGEHRRVSRLGVRRGRCACCGGAAPLPGRRRKKKQQQQQQHHQHQHQR